MLLMSSPVITDLDQPSGSRPAVNNLRQEDLTWIGAEFLARHGLPWTGDPAVATLRVIGLIGILSVLAIDRVPPSSPISTCHVLQNMGMGKPDSLDGYYAFGFFRVSGTVDTDLLRGNMCMGCGNGPRAGAAPGVKDAKPWGAAGACSARGGMRDTRSDSRRTSAMVAGNIFFLTMMSAPLFRRCSCRSCHRDRGHVRVHLPGGHTKLGEKHEGEAAASF